MKQGQGSQSGPQGGQAYGSGGQHSPEKTTSKREKINATRLDPRGQIVGTIDIKGESKRGEAKLQSGTTVGEAIQELTEEVEKEPLPVEHRQHVDTYYRLLRGETGASDAGAGR